MNLPTPMQFRKMREDGTHPVELCRKSLDFSDPEVQEFAEIAPEYFKEIFARVPEERITRVRSMTSQEMLVFLTAYADGIKSARSQSFNDAMTVLMASMIAYFEPDEASMVLAAATWFACDWVAQEEGEAAAEALMDQIKLSAWDMMLKAEEEDPAVLKEATEYLRSRGML